jgi:hypothetical protein
MMTIIACLTAAVAATGTAVKTKHFTGQIVTLDVKELSLTLREEIDKAGAEEIPFKVDPNALVRIHGPKGKLDQLKAGDIVTVTYMMQERTKLVTEIQHM